jgi:hypothetical protein
MLGPHTHRDNPVSRVVCAPVAPPVTVCKHLKIQKKIGLLFCFSENKFPSLVVVFISRSTHASIQGENTMLRIIKHIRHDRPAVVYDNEMKRNMMCIKLSV